MTTSNNPNQTVARCLHSDYFDNIIDYYLRDWIPVIYIHIGKCQHVKCKYYKELLNKDMLTLNSFRNNEEYIKFLENKK